VIATEEILFILVKPLLSLYFLFAFECIIVNIAFSSRPQLQSRHARTVTHNMHEVSEDFSFHQYEKTMENDNLFLILFIPSFILSI
jgi:hypothetical protein